MPHARGGRQARRIIWGMVLASLTVSLVGLVPTTSYASGDDYPYAGLGQCPLVPLPPKPPKPPKPHDQPKPPKPPKPHDQPKPPKPPKQHGNGHGPKS
jgi:hypothetical protein